jgi:glucuronoarabinoxylan endo-1,4-beta-xylanase
MSGKELWETEISDPGDVDGPPMDSGLRVARMMHDHLTIASVSAWHYWWIVPRLDGPPSTSAILDQEFQLTRRAYVMGQYSKFVRPGFVRVDSTDTTKTGTYASAYLDPTSRRFALVVVNERRSVVEQEIEFEGGSVTEVVPWSTSEEATLEEGRSVDADGDSLTIELEPRSVTTLIGTLDGAAPDAG